MANPEHVEIVKRGWAAIGRWRERNPGTILDLRGAYLRDSDLRGANLDKADLREAKLQEARLQEARLYGADLQEALLPYYQICPEEGSFVCYKKLSGGVVATLLVPDGARRCCNLVSRTIRVDRVRVLDGEGYSPMCETLLKLHYAPGDEVVAHAFNDDIRIDCAPGIHVFITRKEADEC